MPRRFFQRRAAVHVVRGTNVDFSHKVMRRRTVGMLWATALSCSFAWCCSISAAEEPGPRSVDDRVVIELFAREPQIVTPTGLTVDPRGRVLVVECHTHFPPAGYAGPQADRLRWLLDTDGDGSADEVSSFYEGTTATMGVACGDDGWIYVATRNEVFRLRDTNGDERADQRQNLARLETQGNYPHNGLSGFAFDFRGGVYFGCGENLGADYRLIGSDGVTLAGGGEGGNVYHCQADGSQLVRVATGFWNPFHLAVDPWERLFAVDNDPDSRPPCRLLDVVDGGDYGYRYRNGRKGLHPFTAWNGELPGTLPMVAGTGEAPSGVWVYEAAALPDEYRGEVLVTSWGDHRIDRFRLEPRGASLRAHAKSWITGGENFRPVGIAAAPDGSLYVSDWVDRSYELHGKGAVWRIRPAQAPGPEAGDPLRSRDERTRDSAAQATAKSGAGGIQRLRDALANDSEPRIQASAWKALVASGNVELADLRSALEATSIELQELAIRTAPDALINTVATGLWPQLSQAATAAEVRAELLRRAPVSLDLALILAACADADPFVQSAALTGYRRRTELGDWLKLADSEHPYQRLISTWLLQASDAPPAREKIPKLLADVDPQVRFAALEWVAGAKLTAFRPQVLAGLSAGGVTRQLFEGTLAALEQLDAVPPQIEGKSTDRAFVAPVRDVAGQDYIAQLLAGDDISPELRRRAVRMLEPTNPLLMGEQLKAWLAAPDARLRLEAIRSLRETSRPDRNSLLLELATNSSANEQSRAEAVVGLEPTDEASRAGLLALAVDKSALLRREALRSLRSAVLTDAEKGALATTNAGADEQETALRHLLLTPRANTTSVSTREGTLSVGEVDAWVERLAGPADAGAGERIFFHPQGPLCFRCHQIDGRGGRVGPDLTNTPQTMTRRRLIESIVDPSREVAPQFVLWSLVKTDGTIAQGVLLAEAADGAQTYADAEGRKFVLRHADIAERAPQQNSVMPAGLIERMTAQEFRDLLAYLTLQRN